MWPVIYLSPCQSNNEFDQFLSNLEKLLTNRNNRKPELSIITGEFYARSQSCWSNHINTTKGSKLLALFSSNGFSRLINEPIHIQRNKTCFIDLIFTDEPGLLVNSGIRPSFHPNFCYHQIIYSTFNLILCFPLPPPPSHSPPPRTNDEHGIIKWLTQTILKNPLIQ